MKNKQYLYLGLSLFTATTVFAMDPVLESLENMTRKQSKLRQSMDVRNENIGVLLKQISIEKDKKAHAALIQEAQHEIDFASQGLIEDVYLVGGDTSVPVDGDKCITPKFIAPYALQLAKYREVLSSASGVNTPKKKKIPSPTSPKEITLEEYDTFELPRMLSDKVDKYLYPSTGHVVDIKGFVASMMRSLYQERPDACSLSELDKRSFVSALVEAHDIIQDIDKANKAKDVDEELLPEYRFRVGTCLQQLANEGNITSDEGAFAAESIGIPVSTRKSAEKKEKGKNKN